MRACRCRRDVGIANKKWMRVSLNVRLCRYGERARKHGEKKNHPKTENLSMPTIAPIARQFTVNCAGRMHALHEYEYEYVGIY